ncbi:MAG: non-homologous end-joining DNA ligase [Terriglobales bacterium]
MALQQYREKRSFSATPEPRGGPRLAQAAAKRQFCVQQHQASHLHYDFRLEVDGVLKSWAVPKGPSLDPAAHRLAMQVEDHPLEYLTFEGSIPTGNYGAGEVIVWDVGDYEVLGGETAQSQLERGGLKFRLQGQKLQGEFALARMRPARGASSVSARPGTRRDDGRQWLLIKKRDAAAQPGYLPEQQPESVLSGRRLQQIPGPRNPKPHPDRRSGGVAKGKGKSVSRRKPATGMAIGDKRRRRASPPPTAGERQNDDNLDVATLPGAAPGRPELPPHPMLATLSTRPFSSPDWLFEIKWDGVRALAWMAQDKVQLWSRAQRDMASAYPELQALSRQLRGGEALVDGEIVMLDQSGHASFSALQQRMHLTGAEAEAAAAQRPVSYFIFDILHLDGVQLLHTPLETRKKLLRQRLVDAPPVRFADHVEEDGEGLLQLARNNGLEGIVAKHRHSSYEPRRSRWWLKWKLTRVQEAAVVGYTAPRGSREHFGSLLLALREGRRWRYIGHVGTGFDRAALAALYARLQGLPASGPPTGAPRNSGLHKGALQWVQPQLVAQVKYSEWTPDGKLRAPVFLGLRDDKAPEECFREIEVTS